MIITGIGSRNTPSEFLEVFEALGQEALNRGWYVRSGHAPGADYAFELGAKENCIVYLPWKSFNSEKPILAGTTVCMELQNEVVEMVYRHEPYAMALDIAVKRIKSRNVYQVLGTNLQKPSDVVVCWTLGGVIKGGTGLAIKLANEANIPVINVGGLDYIPTVEEIMNLIGEVV